MGELYGMQTTFLIKLLKKESVGQVWWHIPVMSSAQEG
jgi:hypothetical protein